MKLKVKAKHQIDIPVGNMRIKSKCNTYMWNLKYDTNELIYETETDSQM